MFKRRSKDEIKTDLESKDGDYLRTIAKEIGIEKPYVKREKLIEKLLDDNYIKKTEKELYGDPKKKLLITSIIIILPIIVALLLSSPILPRILNQYDKLTGNVPNLYITFTLTDYVKNENYINLSSKDEDYILNVLGNSIVSNYYFSRTVYNKLEDKNYCSIYSAFKQPQKSYGAGWLLEETSKEIECDDCSLGTIHFMNEGSAPFDYIRSKICFNEDLIIQSVKSKYIQKRDKNCLTLYKEDIFENDAFSEDFYIINTSGHLIEPQDVISEFSASYGWRGLKEEIKENELLAFYHAYVENCEGNFHSNVFSSFNARNER